MWIAERNVDVSGKFGVSDQSMLQALILNAVTGGPAVGAFGHFAELIGVMKWLRRYRYPVVLIILGIHIGIILSLNIIF